MFLITSELSIFPNYFAYNWPLLNSDHSFVTLGSVMMLLGFEVLGSLNQPSSSKAAFGLAFWRIVAGSGILVIVLGGLNVITVRLFASGLCCMALPPDPLAPHDYPLTFFSRASYSAPAR